MKKFFSIPLALLLLGGVSCRPLAAQSDEAADSSAQWQASLTSETGADYDLALKQVEAYQAAGGDGFLASLRSGWLYYLKKDYVNAGKYYSAAAQLKPGSLNPLLGMLNVCQAQGDPTQIAEAAGEILRIDPLNYRAQMVMAYQDFYAQHYDHALAAYEKVIATYPDDTIALSGQAWSLYDLGRLKEAAAGFRLLLGLNAADASSQKGLKLCLGQPAD